MPNGRERRQKRDDFKIKKPTVNTSLVDPQHHSETSISSDRPSYRYGQASGSSATAPPGCSEGLRGPDEPPPGQSQTVSTKGSLVCYECELTFARPCDISKHKNMMHGRMRYYRCLECPFSFRGTEELNRHIVDVHRRQRTFLCTHCEARFRDYTELAIHKRMDHSDKSPFLCRSCPASFKKKNQLIEHETLQHSSYRLQN